MGIQGQLAEGVHHLANDVDRKIVKSAERSDRQERVIDELYEAMQILMVELESNREHNIQTQEQFAPAHRKLEGRITR